MSPYWNHILANQVDISMGVLKSRGMSAVCIWGLRGIFFSYLYFLCSSPTVLCAALWQSSFLRMYHTNSNTPNFWGNDLRAYFWPSAITPPGGVSFFTTIPPVSLVTIHPSRTPFLHLRHWIHISAMSTKIKPPKTVTVPAVGDSPARRLSTLGRRLAQWRAQLRQRLEQHCCCWCGGRGGHYSY
jgi:hypothetical protein